jgi:cysteine-rich repeat protein
MNNSINIIRFLAGSMMIISSSIIAGCSTDSVDTTPSHSGIDNDGDGFFGGDDCDDSHNSIYPGAVENCDDGIAQNCDGEIDEGCNEGVIIEWFGHDLVELTIAEGLTSGRYVRITGGPYLSLAEVEVLDSSGNNLALNGTATQSSTFSTGLASRAIDGNIDGNWAGESVSLTDAGDENWWMLDLRSDVSIASIRIYNAEHKTERLNGAKVEIISGDGDVPRPSDCGDNVLDVGEQCDDGNNIDGDGCQTNCELSAYTLTVFNGIGDGRYKAGAIIAITTEAPPENQEFDYWELESDTAHLVDANSSTTILTMGSNDATVTARYRNMEITTNYTLYVISGSGDGDYESGQVITITANAPPADQEFDLWEVDSSGAQLTDASSSTTTITMGESDSSVTARYRILASNTYALSVINGSGDGDYESGQIITITADAPPANQEFDQWVTDLGDPAIADANASTTTVTTGASNATITATYEDLPPTTYALNVLNGSGDGDYESGQVITITADAPPANQEFDRWVTDLGNPAITANASTTTLTMGASDTTITATYEDLPTVENLVSPDNGAVLEYATSEFGDGWGVTELTDGVTNHDGWSSEKDPGVQEFVYSFRNGQSATLIEAVLYAGTAEDRYFSRDVQVGVSTNGIDFVIIASGTLADNESSIITLNLGDTVAMQVKLVITSGYRSDYWELGEFVVNGFF